MPSSFDYEASRELAVGLDFNAAPASVDLLQVQAALLEAGRRSLAQEPKHGSIAGNAASPVIVGGPQFVIDGKTLVTVTPIGDDHDDRAVLDMTLDTFELKAGILEATETWRFLRADLCGRPGSALTAGADGRQWVVEVVMNEGTR
jgi:hypothetical protein